MTPTPVDTALLVTLWNAGAHGRAEAARLAEADQKRAAEALRKASENTK